MSIPRINEILDNKIKTYITRATGAAAIALSVGTPETGKNFVLKEVRVSLSAVGASGNLTITINNVAGAVYDHVLLTQDMTSIQYLRFVPAYESIALNVGDTIDIAWANSGTKTYGVEVMTTPQF